MQQKKEIKELCPTDVFDIEDGSRLIAKRQEKCIGCGECEKYCFDNSLKGYLRTEHIPNLCHFTIESTGARTPASIFQAGRRRPDCSGSDFLIWVPRSFFWEGFLACWGNGR